MFCIILVTANFNLFFISFQKNAMTDRGEHAMEEEILQANKHRAKDPSKRSLIFASSEDDNDDDLPLKKPSLSMASTQRLSESVSYFICLWSTKTQISWASIFNIFHRIVIQVLTGTILSCHPLVMLTLIIRPTLTSERYVLASL